MVSLSANSFLCCTKQFAGRILITAGLLLLALNLWGTFDAGALRYRHFNPAMAEVQGFVGPRDSARANRLVNYLTNERPAIFNLVDATHVVHHATVHSDGRRIGLTENWLQWLLGKGYPPLAHVQLTERLVHGCLANCSERAQILKSVAEAAGLSCRFVGLNGHVVLEVCQDGQWRVADPGYDIVYEMDVADLQQSEAAPFVREQLQTAGYPTATVENYLRILQSADDNVVLPVGGALSPRLYAAELACNWLVWLIPIGTILAGMNFNRICRQSGRFLV